MANCVTAWGTMSNSGMTCRNGIQCISKLEIGMIYIKKGSLSDCAIAKGAMTNSSAYPVKYI